MTYQRFIYKYLRAAPARTGSTIMAIALCVFLVCTLQAVLSAVRFGLRSVSATRLVTRSAMGLTSSMPTTYKAKIAAVPGVVKVAVTTFFMGFRGTNADWGNYFPNYAVDDDYFAMHPELIVSPEQMASFLAERRGCLVGAATAKKMGWRVGDRFQLESIIPPYKRPGGPFEFTISGIYTTDARRFPGSDPTMMLFHFKYLEDGMGKAVNTKTFSVSIADGEAAGTVGQAIDRLFENSERPTRTETEAAFQAGFLSMAGNLAFLLNAIGLMVSFAILLVSANTMSMAIRERRSVVAVLKTLGFRSATVMGLVIGESIAIAMVGGVVGVLMALFAVHATPRLPLVGGVFAQAPEAGFSPWVALIGLAVALVLGVLAGFVPALGAFRARITDMLRSV